MGKLIKIYGLNRWGRLDSITIQWIGGYDLPLNEFALGVLKSAGFREFHSVFVL